MIVKLTFIYLFSVDLNKVIHTRPPRPPDSVGRECYVYVLDGASVRNIRDLPIDDLAPWNCKIIILLNLNFSFFFKQKCVNRLRVLMQLV